MSLIKKDALVFDIGGHYGESIDKFQVHYGAGLVISVEPCLDNYYQLVAAIATKGYTAIPIHAAAWSSGGVVGIRRASAQTGLTTAMVEKWSAIYGDVGFGMAEDVAGITLDQLIERYGQPQYIKIDVEGAEVEVLKGLTFKPEVLSFEFHGAYISDALWCLDHLKGMGFTKADCVPADVDLDNEPVTPIDDFTAKFAADRPNWGNVTLV